MPKVLITDPLSAEGLKVLETVADVVHEPGMPVEKIKEEIKDADAMLVRSGTTVTAEILEAAGPSLKIIGRAGVGVDNIDLEAATSKGIVVVNSPDGNTTAAAEHTVSLMMALARNIAPADRSLKAGAWDRKKYTGVEMRDKVLAVIGLGKIGSKVAEVARALGMRLYGFDPLMSEERAKAMKITLVETVEELWSVADFITLHVPKIPQTENMINAESIAKMKDGVRIINCARGGIVNEADLAKAIEDGKVAGAALDVYASEPLEDNSPLRDLGDKVVITPHLGASTAEAQVNVAVDVAEQIVEVLSGGFAKNAVNLKGLRGSNIVGLGDYMELSRLLASLLDQYSGVVRPDAFSLTVSGKLAEADNLEPIMLAALSGYLSGKMAQVTLVNAKMIAEERDIKLSETKLPASDVGDQINIEIKTDEGVHSISGMLQDGKTPVITGLDGHKFYLQPSEHMLVTLHKDQPGIVAGISQILGKNHVNISGLTVSREEPGHEAVMVCAVDEELRPELLAEVSNIHEIKKALSVNI